MKTFTSLLLSSFLLLTACEAKRQVDEMHDATLEMNKTTADLSNTSKELGTQTGELYDALRQGDSLQLRRNALENLVKATDPANKLSEAAKYFMSFEYQLWSGQGPDATEEKRQMLALSAVREFFKDVLQFIPADETTAKPLKGQMFATSKGNMVHSLNALSAAMHMLNPKQEAYVHASATMKPISMLSLITEGLSAKAGIESGATDTEKVPEYIREILANEQSAVYLLKARYNYIPTVLLGRATDISHSKLSAVKMYATKWNLDLQKFNSVQIREFNLFAKATLETAALLKSLGYPAAMDPQVLRIYRNMNVVVSSASAASTQKAGLETDFAKNIELLKAL